MATAAAVRPGIRFDAVERVAIAKWFLDNTNAVGDWLQLGALTDVSFHIFGSGFNGGSVSIHGSNDVDDKGTFDTLTTNVAIVDDLNGNALTFTAAAIEGLGPAPVAIRPKVTAGALAAGGVTIVAIARKQARG